MKLWRVDDVMTRDVVSVEEDTPYQDVVAALIGNRVSAVPVVDHCARVVGVVSEADLLQKVEAAGTHPPRLLAAWRYRTERAKAVGRTAGDVMTAPAVTVLPSLSGAYAARLMHHKGIKRLPVETELGRLVGIVTRSDLLRIHLRSDEEIRHDVVDQLLGHVLDGEPCRVRVQSTRGVVTLIGHLYARSTADRVVQLAGQVAGVVGVRDDLDVDLDGVAVAGSAAGMPFGVA